MPKLRARLADTLSLPHSLLANWSFQSESFAEVLVRTLQIRHLLACDMTDIESEKQLSLVVDMTHDLDLAALGPWHSENVFVVYIKSTLKSRCSP